MGTLVTLSLPPDSPVAELPWVITIGALSDSEEWEPVVCGPYERAHALALAQAVVADEDLMAVVEPLLPLVDTDAIRHEIDLARAATDAPDLATHGDHDDGLEAELDDYDLDHGPERVEPGPAPTADQVRAGFARVAARLPGAGAAG